MKISVQSVNFNIDNDLMKYIEKKLNNLEKFHDQILGAEVFLKVQSTSDKENKITDIKINLPGNDIVIKKESKTFEEGVSMAVDSLKRQLVKRKEKIRA
ncbi:MAG: ribosome-associated translation inhibitor RaiA [Flavobacteriaceae bacterium]|nr:ribosome-associated translation inhibitor RaiA [Flavobacteriaceae bacterium]